MKNIFVIYIFLFFVSPFAASANSVQEALELTEAGWNFMYFGQPKSAEEMFSKAVNLDPKNRNARLGYAKSQIENKKYSQAKETLSTLSADDEKTFLEAIADYWLDDFASAEEKFSSLFSGGGKYAAASAKYIEALGERRKKLHVSAQFGLVFDSRIIDEDLLSGVDEEGGRIFMAAAAEYRHKKTKLGDLSFGASVANYYSIDDDQSLADPLKIDLGASLRGDLEWRSKQYFYDVDSGLEFLWLDIDNSGSRELLYWAPKVSAVLSEKTENQMSNSIHTTLRYYLGDPDSLEDTSSDIDGLNLNAGWKFTRFLNTVGTQLWQTNVFLESNLVSGDSLEFWRAGYSYTYLIPYKKFQLGAVGDARFTLYPKATNTDDDSDRHDIYLGGGVLAQRSIKEWFNPSWMQRDWLKAELRGGFAVNASNLDSRDYERFVLSLLLKGNWKF